MPNEIEKFDPSTLMEGVRNRIKATFVSLIPDTQWEQMVNVEIEKFFKIENDWSSSRDNSKSPFIKIVREELDNLARAKCKEMLEKYTCTVWENNEPAMSDALKKLMEENAQAIFIGMFRSMFQGVVNDLKNRSY